MAANSRTFAPPCATLDTITATQFNKLDTNGAGAVARASTKTGWRRMPMMWIAENTLATPVLYSSGGIVYVHASGTVISYLPDLPDGHILDGVGVHLTPAGAHGGEIGTKPKIELFSITALGVAVSLGSETYVWSDVPTYEAGFYLNLIGVAETINQDVGAGGGKAYVVEFTTEGGANFVTDGKLDSLNAYVTVDTAYSGADFNHWLKA
jgi:hypothetical protein